MVFNPQIQHTDVPPEWEPTDWGHSSIGGQAITAKSQRDAINPKQRRQRPRQQSRSPRPIGGAFGAVVRAWRSF